MIFKPLPAPFPGQKVWGAIFRKRQYVIVEDEGDFTASYRKLGGATTMQIIDFAHRVRSFEVAKTACEAATEQ